jgi:hypothetical protein
MQNAGFNALWEVTTRRTDKTSRITLHQSLPAHIADIELVVARNVSAFCDYLTNLRVPSNKEYLELLSGYQLFNHKLPAQEVPVISD